MLHFTLELLGRFAVHDDDNDGGDVTVAPAGQRVLALVALQGGSTHRSRVAGTLWPDRTEARALANLRSALWRLPRPIRSAVAVQGNSLGLGPAWKVDVDLVVDAAGQLRELGCRSGVDRRLFEGDLLPSWDSEWLTVRRERHRQLRLHALEDLALAEIRDERPLDAVDTAMQAVAAEPLRESAQMLVLQAHLAAGNRVMALRHYRQFRALLADELGFEPSRAMRSLVAGVMA
jgi:DNA-binding SARP family transcriptional activator